MIFNAIFVIGSIVLLATILGIYAMAKTWMLMARVMECCNEGDWWFDSGEGDRT